VLVLVLQKFIVSPYTHCIKCTGTGIASRILHVSHTSTQASSRVKVRVIYIFIIVTLSLMKA